MGGRTFFPSILLGRLSEVDLIMQTIADDAHSFPLVEVCPIEYLMLKGSINDSI